MNTRWKICEWPIIAIKKGRKSVKKKADVWCTAIAIAFVPFKNLPTEMLELSLLLAALSSPHPSHTCGLACHFSTHKFLIRKRKRWEEQTNFFKKQNEDYSHVCFPEWLNTSAFWESSLLENRTPKAKRILVGTWKIQLAFISNSGVTQQPILQKTTSSGVEEVGSVGRKGLQRAKGT